MTRRRHVPDRPSADALSLSVSGRHEADLFWASLMGEPVVGFPATLRARTIPAPPRESEPSTGFALEADAEPWVPAEAMPAGPTASPCDISKTSETLDGFALDRATLTAAHGRTIGTLAGCILALR